MSFLDEIEAAVATLPQEQQIMWMRFRAGCTKVREVSSPTRRQMFFHHPKWSMALRVASLQVRHITTPFPDDFVFHYTRRNHPVDVWKETLSQAMAWGLVIHIAPRFTPPKIHGAKIDLIIIDDIEGL